MSTFINQFGEVITDTNIEITGDVTVNLGASVLSKIQTVPLSITALTSGDVLKYNGTDWANTATPIATTSSLGQVIVGGGLNVQLDGTIVTKDTVAYQARALSDLSTNPDGSGQGMGGIPLNPGYYWNALGYRTIIVPDPGNPPDGTMEELENTCAPGTTEWQYYYWDGATASSIVNLNVGDYIEDITLNGGMTVKVYDDPANLNKKYLAVAQPVTDPAKFNQNSGYFKGYEVSYQGTNYTCIVSVPATGSSNAPDVDPAHWVPSAYAGGMTIMVGATSATVGAQGIAPQPLAGEQRKALIGDGTWRPVTLAQPSPTDIVNPEFAGNIISRISADETKLFIDYQKSDTNIVSIQVADMPTVTAAISASTNGLWDDRGGYDASGGTFPATGGSGSAGAILKGDTWTITVAGTMGGVFYPVDSVVRALVDSPAQTASNWTNSAPAQNILTPVTISANTVLNNSHHDRLLRVTGAFTLTANTGLRADFRCRVQQTTASQVTFVNGTVTYRNSYSIGANAKTASQYATIYIQPGPSATELVIVGDITA